jgi:hypothetical protein
VAVGVLVGAVDGPWRVGVIVGVDVGGTGVAVRVAVAGGVGVRVGVLVASAVAVFVGRGVFVGASAPWFSTALSQLPAFAPRPASVANDRCNNAEPPGRIATPAPPTIDHDDDFAPTGVDTTLVAVPLQLFEAKTSSVTLTCAFGLLPSLPMKSAPNA